MWISRRIPALRHRPILGYGFAVILTAAAVALRSAFPLQPPFLTLFPAVLLAAFLGGRGPGIFSLAAGGLVAWWYWLPPEQSAALTPSSAMSLVGYAASAGLIIFVVGLLDGAVARANAAGAELGRERERLALALSAAGAGAWELTVPGKLEWDRTFFELLGLDPEANEVSGALFVSRLHPDDQERAREEHRRTAQGIPPAPHQLFRIIRPDGRMIWVESHRAISKEGGKLRVLGVLQDVTRQRESEERLRVLIREVSHRVKNQYAVILAMIREVARHTRTAAEFQEEVEGRIHAMARSHDLLIEGAWAGADLEALLRSQLQPFGSSSRWDIAGPNVTLRPGTVQYLGMAFYELATNAAKHGALSTPAGRISVAWRVEPRNGAPPALHLAWRETGGPPVTAPGGGGFGRKVLEIIAPAALGGTASLTFPPGGTTWELDAAEAILPVDLAAVAGKSAQAARAPS